jgi:serine/threonine protein kinase
VDQVAAGNGWTMWKALDETLARPVSVLTFAPGFPRIPQVVTAARAASRLTDPRMAQVFDVEDGGGQAYIVLEWVGGESLAELLDAGPIDPPRACALVADAARAMSGAHAVGQAHLRLTPDTLRWTRSSGIKITGLGIDAALAGDGLTGAAAYDPALADTIALAALLYAALTGYWPGDLPTRLPAAPVSDGAVCTPRQVSADVSSALDSVVTRALLQRPTRQGPPIQTPGAFADALASVAPPVPLPEPAPAPRGYDQRPDRGYPDPNNPGTWPVADRGAGGTAPYSPPSGQFPAPGGGYGGPYRPEYPPENERGGASRVMLTVVVVLVLVVIAATVWAVGLRKNNSSSSSTGSRTHPSASHTAAAAGTVLHPVTASSFNVFGTPPGNTEDPTNAKNPIDGSTTPWATEYYLNYPAFGNAKPGTGLLIDMGRDVKLSQVEVLFGPGGTTAEIYLGNSPAMSKATGLNNFKLVSPSATASGDHKFPVTGDVTGRYVLIWLTRLPPMLGPGSKGKYQGLIYNVVIRGSYVSGTS